MIEVLSISMGLLVVPLAVGALLGRAVRHLRGDRAGGVISTLVCVAILLLAVTLFRLFPIVGIWDAGLELLLLCIGTLVSLHGLFTRWGDVVLASCSPVVCS